MTRLWLASCDQLYADRGFALNPGIVRNLYSSVLLNWGLYVRFVPAPMLYRIMLRPSPLVFEKSKSRYTSRFSLGIPPMNSAYLGSAGGT